MYRLNPHTNKAKAKEFLVRFCDKGANENEHSKEKMPFTCEAQVEGKERVRSNGTKFGRGHRAPPLQLLLGIRN